MAISSGCVGEEGCVHVPHPPTVFLAFRVTLQRHSAKSVCCSPSSAAWGPSVSRVQRPKRCSVIDFVPLPQSSPTPLSQNLV